MLCGVVVNFVDRDGGVDNMRLDGFFVDYGLDCFMDVLVVCELGIYYQRIWV